jgi:hypothetical protein
MGTGPALAKSRRSLTRCNIRTATRGYGDFVIPGWSEGPDPESRDSGFASSTRPGMTRAGAYPSALIFSAAFGAKYVKIPSAPARLKASRLSIIARSPSIQPLPAAAAIIAYSPDT